MLNNEKDLEIGDVLEIHTRDGVELCTQILVNPDGSKLHRIEIVGKEQGGTGVHV